MGGLAALFGNSEEKPQDSEKLMDLYWNRAELKKSFAREKKEQYKLKDQIKRQEGATARLQQKLDHLEDLLLDPQWVHNVVVFYQLRALAVRCERSLAKFAEELKQQREQREHDKRVSRWKAGLEDESTRLEESITSHRSVLQKLEEQLAAVQETLNSMGFFAKIFKARKVKGEIRQLEEQLEAARAEEESMLADLASIKQRAEPEKKGLNAASKRSINIMILAYAQQLYFQFGDSGFATLVKESNEKSVGSVNYGNKYECSQILEQIEKRLEAMEQNRDFAAILRKRASLIGEKAEFRNKSDVVPVAASTATAFDIDEMENVREKEVPILGENWWAIAKILSR